MADVIDALYAALQANSTFAGKTFRDRPGGSESLPFVIVRGAVGQQRKLDLDGGLRTATWRLDVADDDGHSSEIVEEMAEACATLFDEDPGLDITGFTVCGCSSDGPTDLPPDAETYGRSVLVTLWLEKE
jgi:hypothetical protein